MVVWFSSLSILWHYGKLLPLFFVGTCRFDKSVASCRLLISKASSRLWQLVANGKLSVYDLLFFVDVELEVFLSKINETINTTFVLICVCDPLKRPWSLTNIFQGSMALLCFTPKGRRNYWSNIQQMILGKVFIQNLLIDTVLKQFKLVELEKIQFDFGENR